jgi:amino acid permease
MAISAGGAAVFEWLLSISGCCALLNWGSICLAHIRFRKAWKHNGRSLEDLAYKSPFGIAGSWIGFITICLLLSAQVFPFPLLQTHTYKHSYMSLFLRSMVTGVPRASSSLTLEF